MVVDLTESDNGKWILCITSELWLHWLMSG